MTPDSKAIVAAFFAAAAANDQARISEILDPGVVVIEAESLPYGGRHVGIEAFRALVRRVFLHWRDTRVEVHDIIGGGETVIVLATMHGRSKADGTPFAMPIAEIWRMANARVVSIQPYYFDTRKLLDTLEHNPPANAG